MNILLKLMTLSLSIYSLAVLSGCALGAGTAATAGYSLKSQSADSLTADAEQKIVERAKKEIIAEIMSTQQCASPRGQ